jgi:uncharacterized protein (TIGR00369 family)
MMELWLGDASAARPDPVPGAARPDIVPTPPENPEMTESKISAAELERLAVEEVPVAGQMGIVIESIGPGEVTARVPHRETHIRPGGTIAGPVMMALADFVMWGVVMSLIGPVKLAVTTSLHINFLRRPGPGDLIARGRILKLGKRLAVGEVYLNTHEADDLVAHVTATYSIPPQGGGATGAPRETEPV